MDEGILDFNEVINEESWEIIHDQVSGILEKKYENVLKT